MFLLVPFGPCSADGFFSTKSSTSQTAILYNTRVKTLFSSKGLLACTFVQIFVNICPPSACPCNMSFLLSFREGSALTNSHGCQGHTHTYTRLSLQPGLMVQGPQPEEARVVGPWVFGETPGVYFISQVSLSIALWNATTLSCVHHHYFLCY